MSLVKYIVILMTVLLVCGTAMMIFGPAETQVYGKRVIEGTLAIGAWAVVMLLMFVG